MKSKHLRLAAYTLFIFTIGYIISAVTPNSFAATGDSSEVEFDHSNCQYPDRKSNPPNGCDNTDPPCGEEAKGGTCKAGPIYDHIRLEIEETTDTYLPPTCTQ